MKFVRLGKFVVNIDSILYIQKIGSGCNVYLKDNVELRVASIEDEAYENAIAYICCGGANNGEADKG